MAIDTANPPKFVTMPWDLANAVYAMLDTLPHGRVRPLMARLEAETQPMPELAAPVVTAEDIGREMREAAAAAAKPNGKAAHP